MSSGKRGARPRGTSSLGKDGPTKTDEFLEKFQTAFDPPPLIFGKTCCAFFPEYMTEEAFIMAKICNINFWIGNDPPPPFGTFPKIHHFWRCHPSLRCLMFYLNI